MRFIALVLIAAGFLGGFVVGMRNPLDLPRVEATAPVRQSLRFDNRQDRSRLESGWGRTQGWGTPLAQSRASVMVGFDGKARGDVELLIEAKTQGGDKQPLPLTILFNGTELGRWRVGDSTSYLRRRFVIPKEVVNQDTVGHLSFAAPGDHKTPVFGLVALELRDLRPRPGRRGFVDGCSSTRIAGWAVADKVGSTVSAKVNGRPLPHIFTSEVREDLAENGLPEDSGFVLTPKSPIPAGTTIEVEFFDGRPLANSPCRT